MAAKCGHSFPILPNRYAMEFSGRRARIGQGNEFAQCLRLHGSEVREFFVFVTQYQGRVSERR